MTKVVNEMNKLYPLAEKLFEEREGRLYDETSFSAPADAIKIKSKKRAESVSRSYLLKKREQMHYVTALHVTRTGVTRRLAPRAYNRSHHYAPIKAAPVAAATDGCVQAVDRYSDAYLYVTVESSEVADILKKPIYRKGDMFFQEGADGVFRDIVSNAEAKNDPKGGALAFLDPKKSGYENLTAGQSKSFTVPLVCSNHPEYDARLVKYLLTYGASEALQGDEEVTTKELAQGNTRLSQNEAPNTPMGYVGTTAYFMGKYRDAEGNDYRDGFGFVLDKKVARLFTFLTDGKYSFSPNAVRGILLQCRPHLCKLMAETVRAEYMSAFAKRRHDKKDCILLVRSEITDKDQESFILAVKSKGKKGPFAGKLVILGDSKEELEKAVEGLFGEEKGYAPDFLTDLNGLKAPFDLRFRTTLNVLDISHATHDVATGANFSTQLFQSMMHADWKKACSILVRAFRKHVKDRKKRLEKDGIAPSILDFENPQYSQMLVSMCPRIATRWYFPLLKQVGDALLKGLVNRAGRLRVPTEGIYCKVTTDPSMDFGKNVLKILNGGMCECLAPRALETGYSEGIAVKYPKQHFREFAKLKFISVKEYIEKVDKLDGLSNEEKELLKEKAKETSGGQIVLPCYELLKNMLAGMDYDGDAVIVYLDKEVNNLLKDVEPLAVVIKEDKKDKEEAKEEAKAAC